MARPRRTRRYRIRVSPAPQTVEVEAVSEEAAADRAVHLVRRRRQHWTTELEAEVVRADDENPEPTSKAAQTSKAA